MAELPKPSTPVLSALSDDGHMSDRDDTPMFIVKRDKKETKEDASDPPKPPLYSRAFQYAKTSKFGESIGKLWDKYRIEYLCITALIGFLLFRLNPQFVARADKRKVNIFKLLYWSVIFGLLGTVTYRLGRWAYTEFIIDGE